MGKIKDNVVTRGFSGKLGEDLVFRQVDGKTVFSKRTLSTVTPTARQNAARAKFAEASLFAAAAMESPEASQEYKIMAELQGLKSAYMAAVTDYLTLPEMGGVYTFAYKGNIGDLITITAKIPLKITGITVSILRADGTVIETGEAVARELKWRYTATAVNALVAGSRLVLKAIDRQGRETTLELVLK